MLPLLLTVTMIFQAEPAVVPDLPAPAILAAPAGLPSGAGGPGPVDTGKTLFGHNCSRCHGNDGTKGFFGAKNLQISRLSDSAITVQILNGKKFMPSFRKRLSQDEIQSLTQYVKTLRTH